MEADRRHVGHIRFPLLVPALAEDVATGASVSAGLTRNLSRSGFGLLLLQEAEPGAALHVTLHLRRRVRLTLTGTVRWAQPSPGAGWDLGMQFGEELPAQLVATIAQEEAPA